MFCQSFVNVSDYRSRLLPHEDTIDIWIESAISPFRQWNIYSLPFKSPFHDHHRYLMLRVSFIRFLARWCYPPVCIPSTRHSHFFYREGILSAFADGYPLEDVMMYWKEGKDSIHNVEKIEMPQLALQEYNAIAHVIALSTGETTKTKVMGRLRRGGVNN